MEDLILSRSEMVIIPIVEKTLHIIHRNIMSTAGISKDDCVVYPLPLETCGNYRTHNVRIGDKHLLDAKMVNSFMDALLPLKYQKEDQTLSFGGGVWSAKSREEVELALKDFYIKFQEIHPYTDGNGRVGGCIVAIMSYLITGSFMMPMEYKFKEQKEKLKKIYDEYLAAESKKQGFADWQGYLNGAHAPIDFQEYLRNWKYKSAVWCQDLADECGFPDESTCRQAISELTEKD